MKRYLFSLILIFFSATASFAQEKPVRYIFVDADCKAGFELLPGVSDKHVVTAIKMFEFEDAAEVLFAEESLKNQFLNNIRDKYPGSVNQFNGIYVYMLNSSDEAVLKRSELQQRYSEDGFEVIELEL